MKLKINNINMNTQEISMWVSVMNILNIQEEFSVSQPHFGFLHFGEDAVGKFYLKDRIQRWIK